MAQQWTVLRAGADRSCSWGLAVLGPLGTNTLVRPGTATQERLPGEGPLALPELSVPLFPMGQIERNVGPAAEGAFVRHIASGQFKVVNLSASDYERCAELIETYADLGLGVVDASLMTVRWSWLPAGDVVLRQGRDPRRDGAAAWRGLSSNGTVSDVMESGGPVLLSLVVLMRVVVAVA